MIRARLVGHEESKNRVSLHVSPPLPSGLSLMMTEWLLRLQVLLPHIAPKSQEKDGLLLSLPSKKHRDLPLSPADLALAPQSPLRTVSPPIPEPGAGGGPLKKGLASAWRVQDNPDHPGARKGHALSS